MPSRNRQFFRATGQLIHADQREIQAVVKVGGSVPHDSSIKGRADKIRVNQGGSSALAAPSVGDGGAAEFDVAISGSGPWDVTVTWLAVGLQALAKGTTTRTITVTSVGAANSPLSIPVKIIVL